MLPDRLKEVPHRRLNPLTGQWVLVSPHRLQRPWQGRVEATAGDRPPSYLPDCYLCPGNARAGGVRNPDYTDIFVFDNDFPSLLLDEAPAGSTVDVAGAYRARPERGICRVVCYSPRHDLTMADMEPAAIRRVVDAWADQYRELMAVPWVHYVQIFENKGELMGCSNPHPHGQIWATEEVPNEPAVEDRSLRGYGGPGGLLEAVHAHESEDSSRVVCRNGDWLCVVPFWAAWPFETLLIPRRRVASLLEMTGEERDALASILKDLTVLYDRLFACSFPYTMGIHQAPKKDGAGEYWHLHFHFYPPLLRSATVRKFMVGFEMLGMPQRDLTPEQAAAMLRGDGPGGGS